MSIIKIGQLATTSHNVLARLFGSDQAFGLLHRAAGIDNDPVQVPGDPKSVSREITLAEDSCDLNYLRGRLRELADSVAWTLRREGYVARCVYIKLRLLPAKRVWSPEGSGFGKLITRRCTLPVATDDGAVVYSAAVRLLEKAAKDAGLDKSKHLVRLLGVGTAALCSPRALGVSASTSTEPAAKDLPLTAEGPSHECALQDSSRQQRLNASIDRIRERHGFGSLAIGATSTHPSSGDSSD